MDIQCHICHIYFKIYPRGNLNLSIARNKKKSKTGLKSFVYRMFDESSKMEFSKTIYSNPMNAHSPHFDDNVFIF